MRRWTSLVGPVLLVLFTAGSLAGGVAPKVVGIAWIAFFAMAGAIPLGRRAARKAVPRRMVWGYGLASGAMLTSASIFLLPSAFNHDPEFGGVGVAAGLVLGYSAHTIGHRLSHLDTPFENTAIQLTAHALAAGTVIGAVYAAMPELGPLLGVAIVSHKAPAGYAAARRLAGAGRPTATLLLPASGVGLTALPVATLSLPGSATVHAVLFGFATGVFLHVAMDFLPQCEVGGEIYELANVAEDAHELLDRLRLHAVASTTLGGIAVLLAWLIV